MFLSRNTLRRGGATDNRHAVGQYDGACTWAPAEFDAMVDWSLALQARAPQMPRKWNEVVYTALEGQDPAHTNLVRGPSQLSGQVVVT
eukprot:COSAG01_NODE_3402_length_6135_cov_21.923956_7_plen_88_part_00